MEKNLNTSKKVIALDVGSVMIGVSVIENGSNERFSLPKAKGAALSKLIELFGEDKEAICVVGMPFYTDGKLSEQGEEVLRFCRRLRKRVNVEIFLVDEAFSTQEASEKLNVDSRKKSDKAKSSGELDACAAEIIGERYLLGPPSYAVYSLDEFLEQLEPIAEEESLEQD